MIGYGQVNHRDEIDPATRSVEPMDLMVAAVERAADAAVIEAVDSIRVVNILSAQYRDPGLLLGQRIGASDFTTLYSPVGGNVPQSLLNQACLDIQGGRAGVVLLAGAETWRTRRGLRAQGGKLVWTEQDRSVPMAEVSGDDVPMAGDAEIRISWTARPTSTPCSSRRCGWRAASRSTITSGASGSCGRGSTRWRWTTRTRGSARRPVPTTSAGWARGTG